MQSNIQVLTSKFPKARVLKVEISVCIHLFFFFFVLCIFLKSLLPNTSKDRRVSGWLSFQRNLTIWFSTNVKTVATFHNLEDLEANVFSNDREKLIICNFFRSNHTCIQEGYTENTQNELNQFWWTNIHLNFII